MFRVIVSLVILSIALGCLYVGISWAQEPDAYPRKNPISFYYLQSLDGLLEKQKKEPTITAKVFTTGDPPRHKVITSGYYLTEMLSRLEQMPAEAELAFRVWALERAEWLPSLFLMELGRLEFKVNQEEGLKWFAVGYFRAAYDAERCADSSAHKMPMSILLERNKNLVKYIHQNKVQFVKVQKQALEWDRANAYSASPVWMCAFSLDAIKFHGNEPQPVFVQSLLKPEDSWPSIRLKLQQEIQEYLDGGQPTPKNQQNKIWEIAGDLKHAKKI